MPTALHPPANEAALMVAIGTEFAGLSRQLQAIARYLETHRSQIGIQSVQQVATGCGVQPSAVVRFAKHFGLPGFTALQALFRSSLAHKISPTASYQARLRQAIESGAKDLHSIDLAHSLIEGSVAGLQELQAHLDAKEFEKAVKALAKAPSVWVMGVRRSFPVAAYLVYALQHTNKQVHHLHLMGAMQDGQIRGLSARDVLLVVSFAPYAEETLQVAQLAHAKGATVIAITDSALGPLAALCTHSLVVSESSVLGFRALTNAMALAQSLFLALAYRLELNVSGAASAAPSSKPQKKKGKP